MCWEIIARVNLGEFGTFNATHCFGKHKRCAPNPFFHDRVIIPHDSTAGTTLAHVSDGLHTLCGLCLARSRCLAQVCIPAMARRARVTCTCGSCLAVRVLAARDCISPVADTHCVRLRLAADAVSPNVVQFVFSLRATASRPSPILAARNYVSPVADAVPMPVFLHAWRACAMCTCGRCLAFSPNVIMIPFVFKRVHKHATSHHPVQMFLQACCTCMLSARDHRIACRACSHACDVCPLA